jgi:CheY-like chemotaxis protein
MEHRFSPIIITTTLDRKEFVVDCLRRGVADVVEKPFRKDRIQQALRQVTLDSKRAPM